MSSEKTESFKQLCNGKWQEQFTDSGQEKWQEKWFLDGERADLRNTAKGMVFAAGPVRGDHGCHAVLWTKDSFSGDIRIEFDYTRLDTICRFVNIMYIQATGIGEAPYGSDIAEWSGLRQVPYMASYFNNMNLLHISYAAFGNDDDKDEDYVRARRYPRRPDQEFQNTDIEPDYFNTGLFRPGEEYHFTFIKTGIEMFFEVKNNTVNKLFHWPLEGIEPVTEGRIGIRHMFNRSALYANVKIYTAP